MIATEQVAAAIVAELAVPVGPVQLTASSTAAKPLSTVAA